MKKKCYLSNEAILAKVENPQSFLNAVDALVDAKYSNLPPRMRYSIRHFVKTQNLEQIWKALNVQIYVMDNQNAIKSSKNSLLENGCKITFIFLIFQ